MGNGAPIPSFPHPRNYRDGPGMGTWYEKTLGIFWGRGWVENWGFLGFYPRKSPPKNWGYFGDGANFNFGDFWGFIPNKLQILGMGTGIISTSGIFRVSSPISLICNTNSNYKVQGCWNQGRAWEHLPSHFPKVASNYRICLNANPLLNRSSPHSKTNTSTVKI